MMAMMIIMSMMDIKYRKLRFQNILDNQNKQTSLDKVDIKYHSWGSILT